MSEEEQALVIGRMVMKMAAARRERWLLEYELAGFVEKLNGLTTARAKVVGRAERNGRPSSSCACSSRATWHRWNWVCWKDWIGFTKRYAVAEQVQVPVPQAMLFTVDLPLMRINANRQSSALGELAHNLLAFCGDSGADGQAFHLATP